MKPVSFLTALCALSLARGAVLGGNAQPPAAPITLERNDKRGQLRILLDGKEALVYRYAADLNMPYYGPFGPRREDSQSGVHFTLKKGGALGQRVGILVHSGNVNAGRVKERFQQFLDGKL